MKCLTANFKIQNVFESRSVLQSKTFSDLCKLYLSVKDIYNIITVKCLAANFENLL